MSLPPAAAAVFQLLHHEAPGYWADFFFSPALLAAAVGVREQDFRHQLQWLAEHNLVGLMDADEANECSEQPVELAPGVDTYVWLRCCSRRGVVCATRRQAIKAGIR